MYSLLVNGIEIFKGGIGECWQTLTNMFGEEMVEKFNENCSSNKYSVWGSIDGISIEFNK